MRTQLRAGEEKVLEVKRHWFILVGAFISMIFWVVVISGIGFALLHFTGLPVFWTILATAFVNLLLIFRLFFWKVLRRKYDIWVVTTERVIDEEGVLSHRAKITPLEKINNTDLDQSFWGRHFFKYGDVIIQSAAEEGETVVEMVMNAKELRDTIDRCREQQKAREKEEQARRMAEAIILAQREETARQQTIEARAKEIVKTEVAEVEEMPAGETPSDDRRPCPYCGKSIKKEAIICRYCREEVEPIK